MSFKAFIIGGVFLSATGSIAAADPLPADAKSISAAQITKTYSGNSAIWKSSMAYFGPDGTTIGVFGNPPTATFKGTWSVKSNKICMTNLPTNIKTKKAATRTYTDCWIYYSSGSTILNSYYNDFEEGKGPNSEYSDGELSNLRKGDLVSPKYAKYSK